MDDSVLLLGMPYWVNCMIKGHWFGKVTFIT
jgi:hypothetical protein